MLLILLLLVINLWLLAVTRRQITRVTAESSDTLHCLTLLRRLAQVGHLLFGQLALSTEVTRVRVPTPHELGAVDSENLRRFLATADNIYSAMLAARALLDEAGPYHRLLIETDELINHLSTQLHSSNRAACKPFAEAGTEGIYASMPYNGNFLAFHIFLVFYNCLL